MKQNDPVKILAWLQTRPSADEMYQAFPEEWQAVDVELKAAIASRDKARLHQLLHPAPLHEPSGKARLSRQAQLALALLAVRQRMSSLMMERYAIVAATGTAKGKRRFNLFNGLLAQRLLFRRGFERKPVSLFWFRLLWPLVWQKRLLMPLVERKGIYCFYSRAFIARLAELIGQQPCLEIAAGDGTLSRFLTTAGVRISASDDHSWQNSITYPDFVVRQDAVAALRQASPKVVLCSWPPANNAFERAVFASESVDLYIVIGSCHRFASGNWSDYEAQQTFTLERRPDLAKLLLPPELGNEVLLFRRLPSGQPQ